MNAAPATEYDVEVFYDGGCPLCRREIRLLQWLDRRCQRIRFTNIDAAEFDDTVYDKTHAEMMSEIYGRLPDGAWIRGVEVFRRLYAAVGFGPLVWLSRVPGISHLLDRGYALFARNRLRLTGRCHAGTCSIPQNGAPQKSTGAAPSDHLTN